jgi:hypothetical protein
MRRRRNYWNDSSSQENINNDDKYSSTGESSFSRDLTVPFDENEILSERTILPRGRSYRDDWEPFQSSASAWSKRIDHRGKGPRGYKRSDDRIHEDVCDALYQSPDIDASEIEVIVEEGVVTLKGAVDNRDIKRLAERVIEIVPGIHDVHNEIRVRRSTEGLIQNYTGMN